MIVVYDEDDGLRVALRALPLEYGRVVDASGAERWICMARPIGAKRDGEIVVLPAKG